MNAVLRSAVARLLSFVPVAIATLVTSRLILRHYGVATFDSVMLIVSVIALVPLNNLGVGAAVTSAYAAEGPTAERSRRVTLTATRVLAVSTFGTIAISVGIGLAGAWPQLLGGASGSNGICAIAVVLYAVSFVPGLGQSMLLGLERNHVNVAAQSFFTPLVLLGTLGAFLFDVPGAWIMLVPPSALVAVNVVMAALAGRGASLKWRRIARDLPFRHRRPGASIRALSGPMFLITLMTPIALQSDRLVLSHLSTHQAVANYSVALQIFAPVGALAAAAAQPLWPMYSRARAAGGKAPPTLKIIAIFGAAAATACGILVLVADLIGRLIGGDQIRLGWVLPIACALSVVIQAVAYPLSMSMMDVEGLRFVTAAMIVAVPLNVGLSILLAPSLGAPGPLFATALVGLVIQVLPALLFSRRRTHAGRHRADGRPPLTAVAAPPTMEAVPTVLEPMSDWSG